MTASAPSYLFTIAVPTYNRASYLDICLHNICSQLKTHESEVELLISDNCSPDATEEVVHKYLSLGHPLTYLKNAENIGPDRNFEQCYRKAKGKYVLMTGDDDVLLDGALDKLLPILRGGDYGVVFLNSYGFESDFVREKPADRPTGYTVYTDTLAFVNGARYLFAFMSANIFNRTLVEEPSEWRPFLDSNLVHLASIFWPYSMPKNRCTLMSICSRHESMTGADTPCVRSSGTTSTKFSIYSENKAWMTDTSARLTGSSC